MPVYINNEDTLNDFFEREIKENNHFFDPMILSEWVYGYRGDYMIEGYYPDLMPLLKKATRAVPDASQADIITSLITIINRMFNEHYSHKVVNRKQQQWIGKYLQEN